MTISLRVVGIFYDRSDIPDSGTQTVKDVLDYAVKNPGSKDLPSDNFKYITSITDPGALMKPSVSAFFSNYASNFTSPTSRLTYLRGEYFLSESLVENPSYEVWQFYVFDANGVPMIPTPRISSFVDVQVPDGGRVVWRLVKILAAPNRVPTVYRTAFGLGDPSQAVV
ncbi:hypothetical protein [Methylobacterium oryzihabitans]|uniref:Uncharacterized protein n=1 Tax=Methylobacterium oryzihabitans TaxID=2499852 RepID=A0A437P8T9_9HYPH|nr:hypothetical protein [Methylobacterium oryzihabitans]RVU18667.1 hypothetical protein EOE48_09780 [Methylobacterium oryzihabitans]